MYKLLLAEDEYIERVAMKQIIGRKYADVYQIYEATNGIEAIEQAAKLRPDMIFMDIKMPGMSGIDAAKQIRKSNPDVKIVFVTAYDYFEYAKAAITIKAEDMLLKPVEVDELMKLMQKWTQQLQREEEERSTPKQIDIQFDAVTRQFEIEFMETIARYNTTSDDIAYYLKILGIEFKSAVVAKVDFQVVPDFAGIGKIQKEFMIKRFVEKLRQSVLAKHIHMIIGRIEDKMSMLFLLDRDNSIVRETILQVLEASRNAVGIQIGIELSDEVKEYAKLPVALYKIGKKDDEGISWIIKYPYDVEREFIAAIDKREFDDALKKVTEISQILDIKFSGSGYRHMTNELYAVTKRAIIKISPDAMLRFADELNDEINCKRDFEQFYTQLLGNAREFVEQFADKNKLLIQKACKYIDDNYTKDLALEEVADIIGYSTYYFMKLIKEYLGMSFIDYVTSVRIGKAKELLVSTSMTISEVGFKVGYNDPNYFTRVFKRLEKVTPSEYKRK